MNVKEQKDALRALYKQKREALSPSLREERDARLCRLIEASASYRYAETLLTYAPIGAEINVMPLLRAALSAGKRVALPRTLERGVMTFHYITAEEELLPGRFGIREPREDAPLFTAAPSTLMLVPGIVFDEGGRRIGYGGGYYDRFLRTHEVATLGLVYRDFILPTLPHGHYDRRVSALATDKGILPIRP